MSLSLENELNGEGANNIARAMGLAQFTVSTVIKNSANLKIARESSITLMAERVTRQREPIYEEMERLLKLWIDDLTRRRMPVSTTLVTTKALSIWEVLKEKGYEVKEGTTFSASKGWFERFKNRASLHNLKLTGEAASSDVSAADQFKLTFLEKIEEGGYSSKTVINFDKTGLYWKRMSSRTFIS